MKAIPPLCGQGSDGVNGLLVDSDEELADALAKLVRSFADPDVAYVCGRLVLTDPVSLHHSGWRRAGAGNENPRRSSISKNVSTTRFA